MRLGDRIRLTGDIHIDEFHKLPKGAVGTVSEAWIECNWDGVDTQVLMWRITLDDPIYYFHVPKGENPSCCEVVGRTKEALKYDLNNETHWESVHV